MRTVAFIGSGNMGSAMARAAVQVIEPSQIVLSNRTRAKAELLAKDIHCSVADSNCEACKNVKYIIFCVKPQMLEKVLTEVQETVNEEAKKHEVIISTVAAGKTISFYKKFFPNLPVIRLMPNTPAQIGEGMTFLVRSEDAKQEQVDEMTKIFSKSGIIKEITEDYMDSSSAVQGCGTAFVCMFIEALADGAVMAGVPRADALVYAAQAVKGTAALVLESGKHPGQLKDEICSPGGSTIVGVKALEDGGFRAAAMNAVYESFKKNRDLGK